MVIRIIETVCVPMFSSVSVFWSLPSSPWMYNGSHGKEAQVPRSPISTIPKAVHDLESNPSLYLLFWIHRWYIRYFQTWIPSIQSIRGLLQRGISRVPLWTVVYLPVWLHSIREWQFPRLCSLWKYLRGNQKLPPGRWDLLGEGILEVFRFLHPAKKNQKWKRKEMDGNRMREYQ